MPFSVRSNPGAGWRTVFDGAGHLQPVQLEPGIDCRTQQAFGCRRCRAPGERRQSRISRVFGRFQHEAVGRAILPFKHQPRAVGSVGDIGGHASARTIDRGGDFSQRRPGGDRDRDSGTGRIGGELAGGGCAEPQGQAARTVAAQRLAGWSGFDQMPRPGPQANRCLWGSAPRPGWPRRQPRWRRWAGVKDRPNASGPPARSSVAGAGF